MPSAWCLTTRPTARAGAFLRHIRCDPCRPVAGWRRHAHAPGWLVPRNHGRVDCPGDFRLVYGFRYFRRRMLALRRLRPAQAGAPGLFLAPARLVNKPFNIGGDVCYKLGPSRKGGRAVEGTGLENRQARKGLVGSNPTPSTMLKSRPRVAHFSTGGLGAAGVLPAGGRLASNFLTTTLIFSDGSTCLGAP